VPAVKPVQRKWLQMEGRNATPYYHNAETGEDVWAKVRRAPVLLLLPRKTDPIAHTSRQISTRSTRQAISSRCRTLAMR
jgi:hypothetical protein